MLHYYLDRVVHVDVERVVSLTPLIHSTLREMAEQSSESRVASTQTLCSFVPNVCAALPVAVRQTAVELCRRRSAAIEPLFALLSDAVDLHLSRLTPHANELLWGAWQHCKPAMIEQHLEQQVVIVELKLQRANALSGRSAAVSACNNSDE